MGMIGSLLGFEKLAHIFVGPQHIVHDEELRPDGKSFRIHSSRTLFALPFGKDTLIENGKTVTKRRILPVLIKREDPFDVKPIKRNDTSGAILFDGREIYPKNRHGHILLDDGNLLKPRFRSNRVLIRDDKGVIQGDVIKPACEEDARAVGVLYATPPMSARIKRFIFDKKTIINVRFLTVMLLSGAFDTAVYFAGEAVGKNDAKRDLLGDAVVSADDAKKTKRRKRELLISNFSPIPITAPLMGASHAAAAANSVTTPAPVASGLSGASPAAFGAAGQAQLAQSLNSLTA